MNDVSKKAKEIVEKFRDVTQDWDERDLEWVDNIDKAKEAALICVDEILSCYSRYTGMYDQDFFDADADFWQNVKTEIQKL